MNTYSLKINNLISFYSEHVLSNWQKCYKNAAHFTHIFTTEFLAVALHVVPAANKWLKQKYFYKKIKTFTFQAEVNTIQIVAHLHFHKNFFSSENKALLLIPGDYGHSSSLLHLAELAQKRGVATFSLHLPKANDNTFFEQHTLLVQQAISKIQEIYKEEGVIFSGILGVGHSKGAILLANALFINEDKRIKALASIAGRLKVPDEVLCPDKILREKVQKISQAILCQSEDCLWQIIPQDDWNASFEAMAPRPLQNCYVVPGMHLSGLYSKETQDLFTDFLSMN